MVVIIMNKKKPPRKTASLTFIQCS